MIMIAVADNEETISVVCCYINYCTIFGKVCFGRALCTVYHIRGPILHGYV